MGDHLGPKYSDRYRGLVDPWRWSVREGLLYVYSKTSLNRSTMRLTLYDPFGEVVSLGS